MIRQYVWVIVMLAPVALVHHSILNWQETAGMAAMPESIRAIPDRIGDYRQMGSDEEVDERTLQVLETSSVLIRNYVGDMGWPVQLTIVYAGATRRSLHFPEVCLVGAGWEIREQVPLQVGFLFSARKLVLVSGEEAQAVIYWFKTGEDLTGNFFLNALYWTRNQITMGTSTSAMIKLGTPVGSGGEEAAFTRLIDFATKFHPVLMQHVP